MADSAEPALARFEDTDLMLLTLADGWRFAESVASCAAPSP